MIEPAPRKSRVATCGWACCGIAVAATVCAVIGLVVFGRVSVGRLEEPLQRPSVYNSVAKRLALYCQSGPDLFPDSIGPGWLTPELDQYKYFHGTVGPEGASVEFGGGFHHFGYRLARDEKRSTSGEIWWILWFYTEDNSQKRLTTFPLPVDMKLSRLELVRLVSEGLNRRIAQAANGGQRERFYRDKVEIQLNLGFPGSARKTCSEMLANMPNNWWARLVNAVILARRNKPADGERIMTEWVSNRPDFFRYIRLGYYYKLTIQPKKAGSAMVAATRFDAEADSYQDYNSEYLGFPLALYACKAGEYQAAVSLCDKLLSVRVNKGYAEPSLRDLRNTASLRLQGHRTAPISRFDWADYDPFKSIDLGKLVSGTDPQAASTRSKPESR